MREAIEQRFTAEDGASLFYRAWLPQKGRVERAVLLFHRGHEHSGRFAEMVDKLDLPEVAFFAWDCRGCGKSPGPRGDADGLAQLESDMDAFLRHLKAEFGLVDEKTVVVAHSVAAVVAGLWVLDYSPRLAGLVLATPALEVKLYVPLAREGLAVLSHFGAMTTVSSYVRGSALTHDRAEAKAYDNDPLISKEIATRVLLDLDRGARRLLKEAGGIAIPTQVIAARADWVVKNRPVRRLFRRLGSRIKEIKVYKDFFHAVFHEKGREQVFTDVRAFLESAWSKEPETNYLRNADVEGPSAERYEWTKAGPPRLSLGNVFWKLTKLSMRSLGRASQGIRLGLSSGYSSGETLDYVYQNQPRGWTIFGRTVDKVYLDSPGWVGIRQRRQHLETLLSEALAALPAPNERAIRLVDIAGGPGRYLLDWLNQHPERWLEVLVRDADAGALVTGRSEAEARGESRISYQRGDAFDAEDLSRLGPVEIAVVSGLYELFPTNEPVRRSLAGLAEAVVRGGYLLYTNQPSHPQLELIAETLTHGDGTAWIMRCRSGAEMDELVREAGFRKIRTMVDRHGIFSVTLAQKL